MARPRLSETARLEAFSDAVFAIVLTLLVLDLLPGERAQSPAALLAAWPAYLAYLTAFLTVGSIWLSHHNAFTRIARADPPSLALNLLLLLGTSLVPWPTALVARALDEGPARDQTAAVLLYVLVTVLIGLPWTALSARIAARPGLLHAATDAPWMRRHARTSALSLVVAAIGAVLAFVAPIVAVVLFLVVPTGFVVLSVFDREPD